MDSDERQEFLMSRARPPTNEAAVFIENRVLSLDQPAPVYLESHDRFVPVQEARREGQISVELWEQANDEKDKLFALMEQVGAKLDKEDTANARPAKHDLRHCSWDQVMQEVQATAARWSTTPKKISKVMHCLNKLGHNSDAFKSWLQLLPTGDYGSSICGVFTLIIGAAGHFSKAEDAILEALARIPEVIDGSRRYIQIYSQSRDHFLERRTFELYLSILKALTHIMRFFADSAFRKVYQPILKQSSYKSDLLASLKDIETRASRIKEEANQCMQRRVMEIDQSSAQSFQILQRMYRLLLSNTRLRNSSSGFQEGEESQQQEHSPKAIERPAYGISQSIEKATELLKFLRFNPAVISKDIETCLRLGDAMDETSKARVAALIRHQTFKNFMTEDASAHLLVNGNEDLSCADGLSPLSLVATKLACISEEAKSSFVLKYFCGEHRPYTGEPLASSPTGMMASLIAQLIGQMVDRAVNIDLSFLTNADWANVKKLKLSVLCTIFKKLISQLPRESVLLCILDEGSLYDTGALRSDADDMFRRITRLVKKHDRGVFKLLLTCRGRALNIGQYFAGHVLDLNETVEVEDSVDWQIANMTI